MRAIVCDNTDTSLASMHLAERQVPEPGPGQVRVRLHAASLNPVDWKLADGTAPWLTPGQVLGVDGAGVVDQLGPGVQDWQVGDRVVWHANLREPGVFAEYSLAPAHVLARIPATVDFLSAAALPCAALTAYQALVRKANLQAGQTLLVQGASGAVGGFAVQLGKLIGAQVIALARQSQAQRVRELGADAVFQRDDPALIAKIKAMTAGGYGVDAMLEVVNPGDARCSLDLLHYNGHLLCIDPMPNLTQVPPYTYAASIHEVALGGAYAAGHRPTQEDFAVMLAALLEFVANGELSPMIERTIELAEVPAGLKALRGGDQPGKTLVTIN